MTGVGGPGRCSQASSSFRSGPASGCDRIVSMARGDDPASALTSFFIVTGDAGSLDGKYTVFGRVVDGLPVVDTIEQTPLNGETPVTRVELKSVRIAK